MNDRFKFRVWDKKSNNYIKVKMFYIDKFGGLFKYEKSKSTVYINAPSPYVMCLCGDNYIVEQCTGLKDKNGKLIYENDVVEVSEAYENGIYKVEFCQEDCEYNLYNEDGNFIYQLTKSMAKFIEVIGNIHENADLLENEE